MGHGRFSCRTTHGSWEDILSYDPWAMGGYSVVRPMGHGECVLPDIVQSKGYGVPILFYNVVRSMGHGSYMPSYGPWAMGIYTPRTASYFPWVMGFCHIVFSMTHGKKVAEPCVYPNRSAPGHTTFGINWNVSVDLIPSHPSHFTHFVPLSLHLIY